MPASRVGTINHAGNNSNACAPRLPPLCSPGVPLHLATFPIPTTLMLEDGTPVTSLTAAYQRAMEVHNRPLPNLAHRPAGFRERTLAALVALHVTDGSCAPLLLAVLGVLGAGPAVVWGCRLGSSACLPSNQLACTACGSMHAMAWHANGLHILIPSAVKWLMLSHPLPSQPLQTVRP